MTGRFWRPPPAKRALLGIVLTVGGIALGVLILLPARGSIDGSLAALVLVVPVAVGVAIGGFPAAPVGIVSGFLAYDFFFIRPYYTLRVASNDRWVSLAVYTAVALIVGGVVGQVLAAQAEAEEREAELGLLYDLSLAVSDVEDLDQALQAVARFARQRMDLATAAILLTAATPAPATALQLTALDGGPLPPRDVERIVSALPLREVADIPGAPGVVAAALPTSGGVAGVLVVAGGVVDDRRRRLLGLFAGQAGTAIERHRLAEETSRSRTLAEIDRLRSALMGAVSHDLRTPLASIKAAVSDLADPDIHINPDDQAVLLSTIDEETDRLTRLVSNLLDMGRIEAGALVPNAEATPIDELIEGVVERTKQRLPGGVATRFQENLPFLQIDYVMVEQVITNLLENVVHHCPPDTQVTVGVAAVGAWAEIRVADNGPGIAPADSDRVFHLFVRAGGGGGGTGMGLAICRGIIEAHGGAMWVEQTPGGGSTFVLRLPLSSEVVAADPEPPAPVEPPGRAEPPAPAEAQPEPQPGPHAGPQPEGRHDVPARP